MSDPLKNIVYGGIAGAVGAFVTSPLEVIKTRKQAHQNQNQALKEIVQKEGVRGLWKGMSPTVLGSIPSRAVYFGLYNFQKTHWAPLFAPYSPSWLHFFSALTANMVSTTITCPLWMIKTRLQLNTSKDIKGVPLILDMLKKEGITSLWKGLGASYLGSFETALQWVIYEKMKGDAHQTPLTLFTYASLSKMMASVVWYPHEVARTRMREPQAPYRHVFHCLKTIMQKEGWQKLYSGLGIHLLRVVPNSAIIFLTFELLSQ